MSIKLLSKLCAAILPAAFMVSSALASDFNIGVYYFPGWKDNQLGAPAAKPWERIQRFEDRKPALGWYEEGQDAVMARHLTWMQQYGINFIAFDWLVGPDLKVYLDHALNAYLNAKDKHGVGFALMWTNHTAYNYTRDQYEAIFHLWDQRYFSHPEYQRLNGKPVVYIFSADVWNRNASSLGMSGAELMQIADSIAKKDGLPGVEFVGGTWGGRDAKSFDYTEKSGFSGFTAYNVQGAATYNYKNTDGKGVHTQSHSYAELDEGYRDQWKWMLKHSSGTYVVPMTSGWDKRPWGGSADPLHDNSISTPEEFGTHLAAAKSLMMSAPDKTQKTGIICCWNEFGEGSFIEPTQKNGTAYLEKIKEVFGGAK